MSLPLIIQCISVFVVSFLPHLSFQTETALVAPVYKHNSTDPILFQYIVQVYLKTPLQSNKLLLDLAHPFSYTECNADYNSSTYQHIPCDASLCRSLENVGQTKCSHCDGDPGPACANNVCAFMTTGKEIIFCTNDLLHFPFSLMIIFILNIKIIAISML